MPLQPVSFMTPSYDYSADVSQIERKRALANALQQQSLSPIDNPPPQPGGFAVPMNPLQGIAKIAQAYSANKQQERADEKQRALAEKIQSDYGSMVTRGLGQLQGTPASEDPAGNISPAQGPDPAAALATFGSHPMGAALAPMAMQEMQRQRLVAALRGESQQAQQQQNPMAPGSSNPSVMAGSGSTVPQNAPAPMGQRGGPAGGQPMEFWLQIDPSGKLYAEQLAKDFTESGKPVVNRGFGIGTMQGGRYIPDQASQDQALGLERGKAGIGAAFGIHNVTNAAGAVTPTFGYQLPGFGGLPGNTQQQPAQQSGAPAQPAAQAASAPLARPQPAAPVASTSNPGDPWSSMPKRPIPQGIGQGTYERTLAEHQATSANELSKKYGELADHANQRKVLNDQALSLVDKADTGPAAAGIADVKNWLTSRFGIAEDNFKNTPSATIALQKDLLNAATQKAKAQFGARMTQSEVLLMLQRGAPNVDMTKAAIKYLIASDNASADYQIRQANDAGKYLQRGGDPLRFDAWYSQAFPMTKAISKVHLNGVKDILDSGGGGGQPASKEVNFADLQRRGR